MAEVRAVFPPEDEPKGAVPSRVEILFREHNDTLLKFLRARLKSDADAHEAAQEAYVRLLQLDGSDQPSFLRAYLFRIAENVARDLLRRRATRFRAGEVQVDLSLIEPTASEESSQEATLAAVQQLQIAERAIRELPPRCRDAILLRRHEGWPVARIAEHLGVSTRMVHLYLERGIEHIQAALNAGAQGGRP